MNLDQNPSRDELRDLLSSVDDSKSNHMLWVGHDGSVHLDPVKTPVVEARRLEDQIRFRLETFACGKGYVGSRAVQDEAWIDRLFNALLQLWADGAIGYHDTF